MAEDTPGAPGASKTAGAGQGAAPRDTAPARVALVGRAGSGKTAVAQAIFGSANEPAALGSYARYEASGAPVIVDDVAGWVNGSESTLGAIFTYLEAARAADIPLSAIWYTLDASTARVTDYELHLVQRLARMCPVVVALTRADLVAEDALEAMRAAIEDADIPNVLGVVAVAADPLPALGIAPYGVDGVMALTPRRGQAQRRPATPPQPEPAATGPRTAQADTEPLHAAYGGADTRQASERASYASARQVERERSGGPYGAAEMNVQPSPALIAILILVPLAVVLTLALFLFGRRRAQSAEDE